MSATWSKPISARMSAQPDVEPHGNGFRISGITLMAEFSYGNIRITLNAAEIYNLKKLIVECENGIVNLEPFKEDDRTQ